MDCISVYLQRDNMYIILNVAHVKIVSFALIKFAYACKYIFNILFHIIDISIIYITQLHTSTEKRYQHVKYI